MRKVFAFMILSIVSLAMSMSICSQTENKLENNIEMAENNNQSTKILMETSLGNITIMLYDDTPKHRDNFIKLVSEKYYDGVLFHRVIKDFMVQTGDPDSKTASATAMLGSGGPDYTIEAEIKYPEHFHKYGALAAARTGDQVNPEKRSSGSQFYIVTGQKYTSAQMERIAARGLDSKRQSYFKQLSIENRDKIMSLQQAQDEAGLENLRQELIAQVMAKYSETAIPAEMVEVYSQIGGTPHLDGEYTVFGEVVDGMDVVEQIQCSETGRGDRPTSDIKIISMKIIEK